MTFATAGRFLLVAVVVFCGVSHSLARTPAHSPAADSGETTAGGPTGTLDAYQLAAFIDARLADAWSAVAIEPASPADDAEFLRRLYLDLVGKTPAVSEVRSYLADTAPDKRRRTVERLLQSAAHATHLGNTWRELLLAGSNNDPQFLSTVPAFEAWLQLRFVAGIPYDQLVLELLTADVDEDPAPQLIPGRVNTAPSPLAFYLANERKPESLADGTSRAFLGLQVGCAQCHDHPFAKWSQEDFWSFAAFFTTLDDESGNLIDKMAADEILIPDTEVTVSARFLDGSSPVWQGNRGRRATLSGWITDPSNPYFARATVNRLWAHFFGRGLVEPVDDLDEANRPSHPRLFEEISRQFTLHGYDLEYVIRAIIATRAYQLSSRTSEAVDPQQQAQQFARMPLRRLTAEQLFDSLQQATGFREPPGRPQDVLANSSIRSEFIRNFTEPGQPGSEPRTSIIQALSLMNGDLVADATSLSSSEVLSAVIDAPFLDDTGRVESLFLATLSRPPDEMERTRFVRFVESAETIDARREALGDVFWALLNSAEFAMNH